MTITTFGLDPIATVILQFDAKNVYRRGVRVTAPDQVGMSGGSVWLIHGIGERSVPEVMLAGFITEGHGGRLKRRLATRTHVALQLVLELEPSVALHLGSIAFGSAT